jgi:hypothetical protein
LTREPETHKQVPECGFVPVILAETRVDTNKTNTTDHMFVLKLILVIWYRQVYVIC